MACACDDSCTSLVSIPGPRGGSGDDGLDGLDGIDAFTLTAAAFTMPAEGADVTVDVEASVAFGIGQPVFVTLAGTFEVAARPSATQLTLTNLEDTATGFYLENATPGTILASGQQISPAGRQGTAGGGAGSAFLIANNLSEGVPATMRSSLGLSIGTNVQAFDALLSALAALATVADRLIYTTGVDAVALTTLTAFARTVLDDIDAVTMRGTLGLGTMATQAASAVAITGGTAVGLINIQATATNFNGTFSTPPTALQLLLAASSINPNGGKLQVEGNGGAVTLTSTPTINAGVLDGQRILIVGRSNANTVTLQNAVTLPGSGLMLGAATRTLGLLDSLELSWDQTNGLWAEVSFVNNS